MPLMTTYSLKQPRNVRTGLSLIEVVVSLGIFVMLAAFMFLAVKEVVGSWKVSERRRALYEKAAGVVDILADDIRVAATLEPVGATDVKCKFISDFTGDSANPKQQRLMFVRTFEAGPERAMVGNAGGGRANSAVFRAPGDTSDPQNDGPMAPGNASYDGLKTGDFKALGGMAMIAYFVKDKTLYRGIKAPVEGPLTAIATPGASQAIATDVLYLGFDYWGQDTQDWDDPPARDVTKNTGPHRIWDSTRGITATPLNHFFLHRPGSLDDSADDVFPRKVRVTVVVDSPMPRCVHTRLLDNIGDGDTTIDVDDVRGFADGDDEDSYLLIDDEWMHFTKREDGVFHVDKRGARNTPPREHKRGATVRTGKVFQRVVFIPNWREDFMSDEDYQAKKDAQTIQPKRILKPVK